MKQGLDGPRVAEDEVRQQGCAHGIVIPTIPRGVLKAPFDVAAIGVDRNRRGGPLVIALANVAVPGPGVARVPVDQVQLGIIGAGGPGRAASVLPGVTGPGVVARLARTGDGISGPAQSARLGVIGLDEATDAVLAAGHTR